MKIAQFTEDELETFVTAIVERTLKAKVEPPREIFDSREAGRFVGRSAKVMERMARAKEIPSFKVGKQYRFRRADLESWAFARKADAKPRPKRVFWAVRIYVDGRFERWAGVRGERDEWPCLEDTLIEVWGWRKGNRERGCTNETFRVRRITRGRE